MTNSTKYIGMDVHQESISITVRNAAGKIVMESVIETKTSMILEFVEGLRGDVHVTFEEGTWSAWLHDLLKPRVTRLVVCEGVVDMFAARGMAEAFKKYHEEHGCYPELPDLSRAPRMF